MARPGSGAEAHRGVELSAGEIDHLEGEARLDGNAGMGQGKLASFGSNQRLP